MPIVQVQTVSVASCPPPRMWEEVYTQLPPTSTWVVLASENIKCCNFQCIIWIDFDTIFPAALLAFSGWRRYEPRRRMGRPSRPLADLYRTAPIVFRDKICCPIRLHWRWSRSNDFSNSTETSIELCIKIIIQNQRLESLDPFHARRVTLWL